jgi:hypothetical protein
MSKAETFDFANKVTAAEMRLWLVARDLASSCPWLEAWITGGSLLLNRIFGALRHGQTLEPIVPISM